MKSKLLIYSLPVLFTLFLLYGYKGNDIFNSTASSIQEEMGSSYMVPIDNSVPQFDLVGAWSTGTSLPNARYYGGGVGYARNDSGWVYVFGGDSTGGGLTGRNLYRYSVNGNSWTTMAPMPQPTRIMASAKLGDSIYSIGGLGNTNPPTYNVYRYSINQNSWQQVASLPDSIYFNRATGYQDSLIYCVGGYNGGVAKSSVYLYNAITNTWRTATSLPVAKADGALSLVGDTLVYVCGFDGTGFATNTVHRGLINQADRSQITWTAGANYPPGNRSRIYAQPWGPKGIIVAGGASAGFTGTNETFTYSPGSNTWSPQANIPAVMLAYQNGSVKLANNIWKFVISGGVTAGPALTANTYIFTDTLQGPPPPPVGNTLVIINDSTASTIPRTADRDTLRKYVNIMIDNVTYMTKNTGTVFPDLSSYSTIIFQETSYDAVAVRDLSASQRTAIKDWLASGTPTSKKSLIMIGADIGYSYSRAGSLAQDLELSGTYGGFEFINDNAATTAAFASVSKSPPGTHFDALSTSPPGSNYWPDGCRTTSGGTVFERYLGRSTGDTLAGISNTGAGWNVISTFQDPRYYTGLGDDDGTEYKGFNRVLFNLVKWVLENQGIITNVNPGMVSTIADRYELSQNYPNPFNPATTINFSIPKSGFVTLKIYDMLGKEVATLVNELRNAGSHSIDFNASALSSGTYFYRIESGNFRDVKKMILLR